MLLSSQWRGGSTLCEGLLFLTASEPLFLLDEPAFAYARLHLAKQAVIPPRLFPLVPIANSEALRCEFGGFNPSRLLEWQAERARLSGNHEIDFGAFNELRHSCLVHAPRARALKTIRMTGWLQTYQEVCARDQPIGGCRAVLLVRHPASIVRSRLAALWPSRSSPPASIRSRPELQMEVICSRMLQDVRSVMNSSNHGKTLLIKYPDLIQDPRRVAQEAHAHLGLSTSPHLLNDFIQKHFGVRSAALTAHCS
ncbi:MAG: hypothetical protein SGPRY_006797 [Prymnesium sp.]